MKKVAKVLLWFTGLALVSTGVGCRLSAMQTAPVPMPAARPFSYEIVALSALPVEKGAEYVAIDGGILRMGARQLSVSLKSEAHLQSFLDRHDASVVEQRVFYAGPRLGVARDEGPTTTRRSSLVYERRPDYLVTLPAVEDGDLGELQALASRAGVQGHHAFHSKRAALLFARALKIRLDAEAGVVDASLELSAPRHGRL